MSDVSGLTFQGNFEPTQKGVTLLVMNNYQSALVKYMYM